jgi:hypothetical protein
MRKTISLFTLLLVGAMIAFTSCKKEEDNYRSVSGNIDPASINKSAFEAYFPLESSVYVITKGRGIDSSKVSAAGTVKYLAGQRGFAYQGDTTQAKSYITIPLMSSGFLKSLKEFTLSCWLMIPVKKDNKSMSVVLIDGGDTSLGTLSLTLDSLNLHGAVFNQTNDSTYKVSVLRSNLKIKQWLHVTFTYDQLTSKLTLFIDGKLQSETVCLTNPTTNSLLGSLTLSPSMTKFYIGAWPQLVSNTATPLMTYFSGGIDEMRMWSKSLSTNSVDSLYKAEYALARNK